MASESRTGKTGAEDFLLGLKGMSSCPKLSTKETDSLLGDINDFLCLGLYIGGVSGSGVNLCFCIFVSKPLVLISLFVGEPNSLKLKMSLVSLTHTEGTGDGVKESKTSEFVFGELSQVSL